jgi:hypothetical protein
MALKQILHKKTWEPTSIHYNNSVYAAGGSTICWDTYDETGDTKIFMYRGGNQVATLWMYDSVEDSWSESRGTTNPSGNQSNEYAGNALAYTSLGTPNGTTSNFCTSNSTTFLTTTLNLVKDISGSKIRIIGGENAGYEGTIVSNTLGFNASIEIDPPTALPNYTAWVEIFSGSVYAVWSTSSTTTPLFNVYDIATNTWSTRTSPSTNTYVQYSVKLTSLPQIGSDLDTGTISSVLTNWLPSNLRYGSWNFRAGSVAYTDGTVAQGSPDQYSTRIDYTSGDGYCWITPNVLTANTTYTFSLWVKTPSITSTIRFNVYMQGGWTTSLTVPTSGVWTRQSMTFTTDAVSTIVQEIGFFNLNPIVYIDTVQLEEAASPGTFLNTTYNQRWGTSNLIPNTNLSTWLLQTGNTITPNQTDPFGGTTAVLYESGSTIYSSITTTLSINIYNKPLILSVYMKAGTTTAAQLYIENTTAGSPMVASHAVVLTTEWVRYTCAFNTNTSTSGVKIILDTGIYGAINTGNIYISSPQLEYGSVPTEFIATTGSGAKIRQITGGPLSQLTFTGKDWSPGSLKNYRIKFTRPSVVNLLAYSTNFANNLTWTTTGGATKTGNVLNCGTDSMRVDVRPLGQLAFLKAGTYTFYIIASGTGTFRMYSYNQISLSSNAGVDYTLTSTPTRFVHTFTYAVDGAFPVFGRMVGNTATAITVYAGQLEYGSVAHDLVYTDSNLDYTAGTQYLPIIDNDANTITVPITLGDEPRTGDTITIEPNGDDIYLSGNNENALYCYNQRANTWLPQEVIPTRNRGSAPGWEHSAIFVNKIDGWSLPKSVPLKQLNTAYTYGDKIQPNVPTISYDYIKSGVFECTVPGTSAGSTMTGWQYVMIINVENHVDGTATFMQRLVEQPGRYIYSFRGNSTATLHIFDITTQMWHSCDSTITFKYAGCGTALMSGGTSYCQTGNYIYIDVPTSYQGGNRFYRFDIKNYLMEPFKTLRSAANGLAQSGQRIWPSYKTVGSEKYTFINSMATNTYNIRRCRVN